MVRQPLVLEGRQVGRFRASVLLFKETFRFLALDKEMLLVPVVAFFLEVALFGVLMVIFLLTGSLGALGGDGGQLTTENYVGIFCLYVLSAFVISWTQAAIVHIVATRAHGGNATLGEGVAVASRHWSALLLWSVITSTVGIILRAIAERSNLLMRILVMIMGALWSVLTYFVVPAIVIGNHTAVGAIKNSGSVFRRTWGETLITNVSFTLLFVLAFMLLTLGLIGIGLAVPLTFGVFLVLFSLFCISAFMLALLSSVMSSVLRTLLYMYASEGITPENFNKELLEQIITRKNTSSVPQGTGTSFV